MGSAFLPRCTFVWRLSILLIQVGSRYNKIAKIKGFEQDCGHQVRSIHQGDFGNRTSPKRNHILTCWLWLGSLMELARQIKVHILLLSIVYVESVGLFCWFRGGEVSENQISYKINVFTLCEERLNNVA